MRRAAAFLLFLPILFFVTGCSTPPSYTYHYVPGKTASICGGHAVPPEHAPEEVKTAIAAANRIAGLPYRYGAGHAEGQGVDTAYDCSGAASFVLKATGKLESSIPSREFRSYGRGGEGDWISVYARKDHVFLVVAGLRFDTGWSDGTKGPQWTMRSRPADGCEIRHPVGL